MGIQIKILLLSVFILIAPSPGFTDNGKIDKSLIDTITNLVLDLANVAMESTKDVVAGVQAQARIKESFARQRVAGLPPHADIKTIETTLRLVFRANSGLLKFGATWRDYPTDEAYTLRAKTIAKELEEHVARLKQIRYWGCDYDDKASLLIKESLGPLAMSGRTGLKEQATPPPYTQMERAYRFGPRPPIKEAKPIKNEKSALWLDWAAATETDELTLKMVIDSTSAEPNIKSVSTETKKATPLITPDQVRIKKALKLWALAQAAENNLPAPKLSDKRLNMETSLIIKIIMNKYGNASSKQLHDCKFNAFVSDIIGKAAKRLVNPVKKPIKP